MKKENYICTKCGYVGYPKSEARGTFVIEFFLWLGILLASIFFFSPIFFPIVILIPIAYSIYRLTGHYYVCPRCHSRDSMIPLDTPGGKKAYKEFTAANRPEINGR